MGKLSAADKMRMQMLRERLTACVDTNGGHFKHLQLVTLSISKSAYSSQHQKNDSFQSHRQTAGENDVWNTEN